MNKHTQFFEVDNSKITCYIITFIDVKLEFEPLKLSIALRES